MKSFSQHLFVLGLDSCDSLATLRSAYRREMLKWHPDRHHHDPVMIPIATERARQLNEALEYLSGIIEARGSSPSTDSEGAKWKRGRQPGQRKAGRPRQFVSGFPNSSVEEIFVTSSNILSIGYNPAKGILYVKFFSHTIYGYYDVPEAVFLEFLLAESHGRFARQHIYPEYRSERLW